MIKNNNKSKHFLKILLSIVFFMLLCLTKNTQVDADTVSSITIKIEGSVSGYLADSGGNGPVMTLKVANVNGVDKAVYCLDKSKDSPGPGAILPSMPYREGEVGIKYILSNGLSEYKDGSSSKYLTGNRKKDYFITQSALRLYLYEVYNETKQNADWYRIASGGDEDVKNKIYKLTDDAKAELASPSNGENTNNGKIVVSNSELNFTAGSENFESQAIKVDGIDLYSVDVKGVSMGDYQIIGSNGNQITADGLKGGESFKVRVKKGISYGIYNIEVNISSKTADSVPGGFKSPSRYQDVIVLIPGSTSTAGDVKVINGKIIYCPPDGKLNWVIKKALTIDGYNVTKGEGKGAQQVSVLKRANKYNFNTLVRYDYKALLGGASGCDLVEGCPDIKPPKLPDATSNSGIVNYVVSYVDLNNKVRQTNRGSVPTGEMKIQGKVEQGSVSTFIKAIPLNVPDIKKLVKAEVRLTLGTQVLNISLPIELEEEDYFAVDLKTNVDDCSYITKSQEIGLRATLKTSNIKTLNYRTTLYANIDGAGYKKVDSKLAYGVSLHFNGQVYYQYKIPEDASNIRFKLEVEGKKPMYSKKFDVKEVNPANQDTKAKVQQTHALVPNGNIVGYLKVAKQDKTKLIYVSCNGCQRRGSGKDVYWTCPGKIHPKYVWCDPYPAFIPVRSVNLNGLTEKTEVTSLKFKSKYLTDNFEELKKKSALKFDKKGYLETIDMDSDNEFSDYVRIKSGYGFEMKMTTKYTNNVSALINKMSKSNSAPSSPDPELTRWTIYPGSIGKISFMNVDKEIAPNINNGKPVMLVSPAADEIPFETLNQVYIKMPDNSYVYVGKGMDTTDGNSKTLGTSSKNNPHYGEKIDNSTLERVKNFEFSEKNGMRKYYLSQDTTNKLYPTRVFTHSTGARIECNDKKMLKADKNFKFNVFGGYKDDVKTQLNE